MIKEYLTHYITSSAKNISRLGRNTVETLTSIYRDRIFIMINQHCYGNLHWSVESKETYLEFHNKEEAQIWGLKHYKNWSDEYKRVMQVSKSAMKCSKCDMPIECYCGYSYQLNEFLRYEKDNSNHTYRELADILSVVLCSAPKIPNNLVLYRMVNDEFINMLIKKTKKKSLYKKRDL